MRDRRLRKTSWPFARCPATFRDMGERNTIACGMYAFNHIQQQAWRDLFAHLPLFEDDGKPVPIRLVFDNLGSKDAASLICAHTCGYPLMKQLHESYTPFCVPLFDVLGSKGKHYSSRIIVQAGSGRNSLLDCRDSILAVNGMDSNSGMNVLRYELARLGARDSFFHEIKVTGGHLHSLEAVATGAAQVAAIDCVSYQLIQDHDASLTAAVDCIGFSASSCGLPFVIPKEHASKATAAGLLGAFKQAYGSMPRRSREAIHLRGFAAADFNDYASILEMENFAISKGYADLK